MVISKKFKFFISSLAIIIVLLYGYWGLVAYNLEHYVARLANESNENHNISAVKFSYDNLSVSGFPLGFDLNFTNLTIKYHNVDFYLGDSSIKLSLFFRKLNLALNEKFFRYMHNNNLLRIENLVSFYSVPKLECKFGWSFLVEIFNDFKNIKCTHQNDGFTVDTKFSDHFVKILQSDGTEIKWKKAGAKSNLEIHTGAYLPNIFKNQENAKNKVTVDLSGEMTFQDDTRNIILKELALNYYGASTKMDGNVLLHLDPKGKTKNDFSTNLNVYIANYQNFAVDFGTLFHIPKFKELIEQFSTIDGGNSKFTIHKELTQPLHIGSMTYTDVMYDIALEKIRLKQKDRK